MANNKQCTQKIPRNDKRVDLNSETVKQAVYDYITEHKGKKAPTYEVIAERTGLSYNTVLRYFKELDFKAMVTPMRALTPLVLNNIFAASHKSVAAQKLWLQVVEGWSEKIEVENTDKVEFEIVNFSEYGKATNAD